MPVKSPAERFLDLGVTGSFGKPWQYGERRFAEVHFGEESIEKNENEFGYKTYGKTLYASDDGRWGTYQKRRYNGKNYYVRMEFMTPYNPRTTTQQSWRDIFRDGMAAWNNLTKEEQNVYHKKGTRLGQLGQNLFMKDYLRSHI